MEPYVSFSEIGGKNGQFKKVIGENDTITFTSGYAVKT